MTKRKMNLYGPINSLGYGIASFNIFKELSKEIDVALFPINWPIEDIYTEEEKLILNRGLGQKTIFDSDAPCLKIWHEYDLALRVGSGPYYVLPFFEISTLDPLRVTHLNSAHVIFAPSQWAKGIILKSIPDAQVQVVPMGVDRTIFYQTFTPQRKCVFFNCGKWEKRKGHDILLDAFQLAFSEGEDVELWMMCENPFPQAKQQVEEFTRKYSSDHRVKLIPRVKTHNEVADIMKHATCGVFPSRAEGWNLELLEMMSMGKPVIATDYSAHTEFCTEQNCRRILIDRLEPANDGVWFDGSSEWAHLGKTQMDQLVDHMKNVYRDWKNEKVYNDEGVMTAHKLTWANTASIITETIYGV